jgi:hypothetical protein
MTMPACDALRVDVPVGYLLPETREILVSVNRPDDAPLSIRLRLIPAEEGCPTAIVDGRPTAGVTRRHREPLGDFLDQEYGGSD